MDLRGRGVSVGAIAKNSHNNSCGESLRKVSHGGQSDEKERKWAIIDD